MDALFSTMMAPGEHYYTGKTQGTTQQASQSFHPGSTILWLPAPCNTALFRIYLLKTSPIIRIGCGNNNNVIFEAMRSSAHPFLPSLSLLIIRVGVFGYAVCRLQSCKVKRDGCEDSYCKGQLDERHLGMCLSPSYLPHLPCRSIPPLPPQTCYSACRNARSLAQINGVRVARDNLASCVTEARLRSARRCSRKIRMKTTALSTSTSPQ
jgi:hypothetical protein